MERITIELTTEGELGAVVVRTPKHLAQTPWMDIEQASELASSIAMQLRDEFPDAPQTQIGFIAI